MKSIYFFLLFCCIPMYSVAQNKMPALSNKPISAVNTLNTSSNNNNKKNTTTYFKLCGNGLFMASDLLHNYIVKTYKDFSASVLYHNIYLAANKLYRSPKTAINGIENSMVQINGYEEDVANRNGRSISIGYRLLFEFKDRKIRVSAPIITDIWDEEIKLNDIPNYIKNRLWDTSAIGQIENSLNNILVTILLNANKKDDW